MKSVDRGLRQRIKISPYLLFMTLSLFIAATLVVSVVVLFCLGYVFASIMALLGAISLAFATQIIISLMARE